MEKKRLFAPNNFKNETGFNFWFMRRTEIEKLFGVSRSSLYGWIQSGEFPQPYRIGPRAVGWRSDEIQKYIDNLQHNKSLDEREPG